MTSAAAVAVAVSGDTAGIGGDVDDGSGRI